MAVVTTVNAAVNYRAVLSLKKNTGAWSPRT